MPSVRSAELRQVFVKISLKELLLEVFKKNSKFKLKIVKIFSLQFLAKDLQRLHKESAQLVVSIPFVPLLVMQRLIADYFSFFLGQYWQLHFGHVKGIASEVATGRKGGRQAERLGGGGVVSECLAPVYVG